MPQLQQGTKYHNFGTFCWQFINGNAAPHLWYNTMMLQFIILMPLFWLIARYVKGSAKRGIIVAIVNLLLYLAWLAFYDNYVFHGIHQTDWYLLDRVFISFLIYAVFGVLAWQFRSYFNQFISMYWWLIAALFIACFIWTNYELIQFGYPINFLQCYILQTLDDFLQLGCYRINLRFGSLSS